MTSNIIVINPLELLEVMKEVGKFDVDLLQPDDDTENWIRKKCGLPLKSKTARGRYAPVQERIEETVRSDAPGEPESTAGIPVPVVQGDESGPEVEKSRSQGVKNSSTAQLLDFSTTNRRKR